MSERVVEIHQSQIVTEIEIATAVRGEGVRFRGLIDTGTQESGVSERVMEQLAATSPLAPDSYKRVASLGRASSAVWSSATPRRCSQSPHESKNKL